MNSLLKIFVKIADSIGKPAFFNWPEDKVRDSVAQYKWLIHSISDAQIDGFICYQPIGSDFEIIVLGVDPFLQGKGLMTKLFEHFVQNICTNESRIRLEVHELNERALKFYKKCGFQIDGHRKNYYKDNASAVNMSYRVVSK